MFPPPIGYIEIVSRGSRAVRSRDCILWVKDDMFIVQTDPNMKAGGWAGGQGVKWVNNPNSDDMTVTYSDGLYGGFLLWGSNESADQYTGLVGQQLIYGGSVLCAGSAILSTSSYERYTYASRLVGPLVALTYVIGQSLYFSSRGLWTNEDEMTLSGNPLAPASSVGRVSQLPKPVNQYFLGIQATI